MADRPVHVLVVDDAYDYRQVVGAILEFHGMIVKQATTVSECREMLASFKPDLVVTDLAMPQEDGWAVLALIRGNPATHDTPVVAITAYHSPALEAAVRSGGFNDYFAKPIDPDTFVARLRPMLQPG